MTSNLIKSNTKKVNSRPVLASKVVAVASNCVINAVAPSRAVLIGNNLNDTLNRLTAIENKTQRQVQNISTLNSFNKAEKLSAKSQKFCKVIFDRELGNFANNTTEKGGADLDRCINLIINNNADFTKGIDTFCAIVGTDFNGLICNIARNMQGTFNHESNSSDNKKGLYISIKAMVKLIQGITSLGKNNKFFTDLFGDSIIFELNQYDVGDQIFNNPFACDMNQWYGSSNNATHLAQVKSILKSFSLITLSENNRSFSLTEKGKAVINRFSLSWENLTNHYAKGLAKRKENVPDEYKGKMKI